MRLESDHLDKLLDVLVEVVVERLLASEARGDVLLAGEFEAETGKETPVAVGVRAGANSQGDIRSGDDSSVRPPF